jgi:hypothetical protein
MEQKPWWQKVDFFRFFLTFIRLFSPLVRPFWVAKNQKKQISDFNYKIDLQIVIILRLVPFRSVF